MRLKPAAASLLISASLAIAAPLAAAPADDFRQLLADHYAWVLRENPVYATSLGVRDYDDRIDDISAAARDRRVAESQAFLARLERIPEAGLSPADRTNRAILKRSLESAIAANRFGQRTMLFTTYAGWHQNFAGMADNVPLRTKADYESYLTRIALYPKLNDAALDLTAEAVRGGFTLPCSVLTNYERGIAGVIVEDPAKSRFYEPFTRNRPADVTEAEWAAMQQRARRIIVDILNPAYAKHRDFYRDTYLPKCARSDSVSAQPGGRDYYAFRVREETTTDLSPERIHEIGLAESARIRTEMEKVAKEAGFASREAYIQELRTNPVYFAKTPAELMEAAALTAKTIDGKMPGFFRTLPRLSYGLRPIPAEIAEGTTTAYYGQGSPESGTASCRVRAGSSHSGLWSSLEVLT